MECNEESILIDQNDFNDNAKDLRYDMVRRAKIYSTHLKKIFLT